MLKEMKDIGTDIMQQMRRWLWKYPIANEISRYWCGFFAQFRHLLIWFLLLLICLRFGETQSARFLVGMFIGFVIFA